MFYGMLLATLSPVTVPILILAIYRKESLTGVKHLPCCFQ